MRLRLTSIDEFQFLTCLKHQLWGSKVYRFKDWEDGDYAAIIVDKALVGLAKVSGKPFQSKQRVWDKALYPNRIPLKFIHAMQPEHRLPVLGDIRDVLVSAWGPKYGWGILNQQLLTDTPAEIIIKAIRAQPNDLDTIQASIEQYLNKAKIERDIAEERKRKRPRKRPGEATVEEPVVSEEKGTAHSRVQSALIRLGQATGCSVYIAPNDRNRKYRGKRLGEGCIESLPGLGLSEEATRHITYIDVIWVPKNAPVCAFEVVVSTSIYSGLLRTSDAADRQ